MALSARFCCCCCSAYCFVVVIIVGVVCTPSPTACLQDACDGGKEASWCWRGHAEKDRGNLHLQHDLCCWQTAESKLLVLVMAVELNPILSFFSFFNIDLGDPCLAAALTTETGCYRNWPEPPANWVLQELAWTPPQTGCYRNWPEHPKLGVTGTGLNPPQTGCYRNWPDPPPPPPPQTGCYRNWPEPLKLGVTGTGLNPPQTGCYRNWPEPLQTGCYRNWPEPPKLGVTGTGLNPPNWVLQELAWTPPNWVLQELAWTPQTGCYRNWPEPPKLGVTGTGLNPPNWVLQELAWTPQTGCYMNWPHLSLISHLASVDVMQNGPNWPQFKLGVIWTGVNSNSVLQELAWTP